LTKGANPGVLFLDDLHFADQASLDLLTFIIRRTREDPFWVLGCIRSEDLSPDHRLRLLLAERQRMGSGSLISLEPFKPAETAQMLSSMSISEGRISEEVYERLHAETEGLPYLVDEYATAIQQALSQGREVDWSLPQSANGLLRSKLSGLSSGAMQLLTAAAVIGRPFDDEMLRQVSGRGEEETVEMLEELIGRRLLQESDPPGEEVGGRYYFHIGKLRTMIYAETSQARKRLLHRRAAESLHRQHGLAQAGQVADHYRRAGMEEEAREHYVRSGDYERSLFANKEALSHYASALDLGHPDRATLLEKMGDLYMLLGEYGESMERYEGAAAYAGNGDRSRYEHKLGLVHHRKGEWLLAERHFEAALRAMEDTDGVDEKALVLSDWALTTFKKGDSARAQDLAEQALDLASQSKDKRAIGQSHNVAGILARHQGDLGKAGELFEVSLKMAQEMEDEGAIIAALNNLALVYADKGEIDKGIETIQEALARCAALGDRHREGALHNNLADLLQASGQKEAALSHIKDSVAIYAEIGVEGGEYQPEIWKLVEW
jgi:predicted ATPase